MPDVIEERVGVPVLVCDPHGPQVTTLQDALDLIGAAFLGAEAVAVPASRLDERFFSLSTRFAGEVMQKFVNYRIRLVVVGDISRHLEASSALRALAHESNRAGHVWFVPDLDAFPHTLVLEFAPEGGTSDTRRVTASVADRSEREVVADFVEWARGTPATPEERELVDRAVEQVRLQEGSR